MRMKAPRVTPRHVWALDIDKDGRPTQAHLILDELPRPGDLRDSLETACGHRYSWNDHTGWWFTGPGQLPLAEPKVHCGGVVSTEVVPDDERTVAHSKLGRAARR